MGSARHLVHGRLGLSRSQHPVVAPRASLQRRCCAATPPSASDDASDRTGPRTSVVIGISWISGIWPLEDECATSAACLGHSTKNLKGALDLILLCRRRFSPLQGDSDASLPNAAHHSFQRVVCHSTLPFVRLWAQRVRSWPRWSDMGRCGRGRPHTARFRSADSRRQLSPGRTLR